MSTLLHHINLTTLTVHSLVDKEMEQIEKACKKGCSACCHQIVDTLTWEEPRIIDFIDANFNRKSRRILSKNLTKWFNAFNQCTPEANTQAPLNFNDIAHAQQVFREQRIACPFLIESACSIYPVRPLVCRIHYQKEAKPHCSANPHRLPPEDAQAIFYDAVKRFDSRTYPVMSKPLAYVVAVDFGSNIRSKPMMGVMLEPSKMFTR
ncbi:YkgJ family cysteine cluster protein [Vibrio jasicida]|uniref:YkgJ family cysteine cluster protein n=1 Tax=Vibrio jasicida TaxID=766224 RepID=UPI0005EDC37C|nr:YkgJ family cysteine cluster protein [Vibrio jasicida]